MTTPMPIIDIDTVGEMVRWSRPEQLALILKTYEDEAQTLLARLNCDEVKRNPDEYRAVLHSLGGISATVGSIGVVHLTQSLPSEIILPDMLAQTALAYQLASEIKKFLNYFR